LKNVVRRDIAHSLGEIFKTNKSLRKVIFRWVGGTEESFVEFGMMLKANSHNQLYEIDFSGNSVKDKGIIALGEGKNFKRERQGEPTRRIETPILN
jgi:hypothetical protein